MLTDYKPDESLNFDSQHTVRLKFLWGQAAAEVITTMGGNVCGGEVIQSYGELENGFTAPSDNEINQKHCVFITEDSGLVYKDVEAILVYHPTKGPFRLELEEAQRYLISVEIIEYKESVSDEDDDSEMLCPCGCGADPCLES